MFDMADDSEAHRRLLWYGRVEFFFRCTFKNSGGRLFEVVLALLKHDADTDSDLARPSDGKHPSAQHDTPAMLLRSATRRHTAGHVVAHSGPSDWLQSQDFQIQMLML